MINVVDMSSVCLHLFSSVDTAGGLYQFQQKGKKRIRRAITKHPSDLLVLWGAEKGKTPNSG